ncbi:low molecular weight protein arginine phosphatase [Metabacillus sp. HB246100]
MTNVLFVCTGNTCRSPMAEVLFRHLCDIDSVDVRSAGVFAVDGSNASHHAIEALKEKGIECIHQSSSLTNELVEWATVILTMTNNHKQAVIDLYPHVGRKTFTLSEYVGEENGEKRDISDPFGGTLAMYRQTLSDLQGLIQQLVKKLQK